MKQKSTITKNKKIKKPWTRTRIFWRLTIAGLILGLLAAGVAAGLFYYYISDPAIAELGKDKNYYHPKVSTIIRARDGRVIGEIYDNNGKQGGRRILVPISSVPNTVKQAFIVAEDAGFYEHKGISWTGIARALWNDLRPGGHFQGGSTITQQVVKNTLLKKTDGTIDRTVDRKAKEAYLAKRVEDLLPKDKILEIYLNDVYFGGQLYGIEKAAQGYFGVSTQQLNAEQASILAALVSSPGRYSPRGKKPDEQSQAFKLLKDHQSYVLNQMARYGHISASEATRLKERPLNKVILLNEPEYPEYAKEFVDEVQRQLQKEMPLTKDEHTTISSALAHAGLDIYTTCDLDLQQQAHKALAKGLRKLDIVKKVYLPHGHLKTEDAITHKIAELRNNWNALVKKAGRPDLINSKIDQGLTLPAPKTASVSKKVLTAASRKAKVNAITRVDVVPQVNAITKKNVLPNEENVTSLAQHAFEGVVVQLSDAHNEMGVMVDIGAPTLRWLSLPIAQTGTPASRYNPRRLSADARFKRGDLIDVRLAEPAHEGRQEVHFVGPEGAAVVIDPETREVLAMASGYSYERVGDLNLVKRIQRQPASAMKPIVWATALEPKQSDKAPFTLASKLNDAPTVFAGTNGKAWKPKNSHVDEYLGPVTLRTALARSLNSISSQLIYLVGVQKTVNMAQRLGIHSSLADANYTLSLGSYPVNPLELTNAYATFATGGKYTEPSFILKRSDREIIKPEASQVISTGLAFLMTSALQSVGTEPGGTTHGVFPPNVEKFIAGKTGTTNSKLDSWFVGYTPRRVAGVWVGFPHDKRTVVSGAEGSAPIWRDLMMPDIQAHPEAYFKQPPDVVSVFIDPESGKKATPGSTTAKEEFFIIGTEPTEEALPPDVIDPNKFGTE